MSTVQSTLNNLPVYQADEKPESAKTGEKSVDDLQTDFLSMLTTQLQNQDPLSPMENQDFTNQMAQFTSLEQQQSSISLLEQILQSQTTSQMNDAVSYIGRNVIAEGDTATFTDGAGEVNFNLSEPVDEAALTITDDDGRIVKTMTMGPLEAGVNTQTVDGVPTDGTYHFAIGLPPDSDVEATTLESGTVEGVLNQDGAVKLEINGRQISIADVWRVEQGADSV